MKNSIMPDMSVYPRWLSVREACRYMSMSENTLMRYVPVDIYGTKKGGKWYIDRYSIDAFMDRDREGVKLAVERLKGRVA
jgi:hypothetical protein